MEILIASCNILDIVNGAEALRSQRCDHQSGPAPQIRHGDTGPGIPLHPVNDSSVPAFYLYVRPHSHQLIHVFEPVLKYALGDDTGSLGQGQGHGNLGLHIRGKARIGQSPHLSMGQRFGGHYADTVIRFLHLAPYLQKLCRNRL